MFASFESIFVDNNTSEILPNLCRHTREHKLVHKCISVYEILGVHAAGTIMVATSCDADYNQRTLTPGY